MFGDAHSALLEHEQESDGQSERVGDIDAYHATPALVLDFLDGLPRLTAHEDSASVHHRLDRKGRRVVVLPESRANVGGSWLDKPHREKCALFTNTET
jgi:hypothetical protein